MRGCVRNFYLLKILTSAVTDKFVTDGRDPRKQSSDFRLPFQMFDLQSQLLLASYSSACIHSMKIVDCDDCVDSDDSNCNGWEIKWWSQGGMLNQFVRTNFAPPSLLIDHFLSAVKSGSSIRDAFIDPSKAFIPHWILVSQQEQEAANILRTQ